MPNNPLPKNQQQIKLEKLNALRLRYVAQLPDKLARIKRVWGRYQDVDLSASALIANEAEKALRELSHTVHSLAGSGGTFGYTALSEVAKQLEAKLSLCDDSSHCSAADQAVIAALISELAVVVEQDANQLNDLSGDIALPAWEEPSSGQLVYLVEDDLALGGEIEQQLLSYGFTVKVFSDAVTAEQALLEFCPAAMIVDLNLPEGELAGARLASIYTLRFEDKTPLIFISARDDWAARLAAARAGGQVYLSKPLDFGELLNSLDAVGLWTDEEPYRVLVVDDELVLAQSYAAILQGAGMDAVVVDDVSSLVTLVSEFQPDLILMDVNMPECSGLEAAAVIRQKTEWISIPIVFLSTEDGISRQMEALQLGGDDFLKKPIGAEHLRMAVRTRIRRFRKLRSRMQVDTLSGLLNHATLKTRLKSEVSRCLRHNTSLVFAMLDLDHFKLVNDSYGHPVGDEVIKNVSRLLAQRLRQSDVVGRYGGEEFAVILPDTSMEAAQELMDELREQFATIKHRGKKGEFSCTFSVGLAAMPPYGDANELIDAADTALYRAKDEGRNRTCISDGSEPL